MENEIIKALLKTDYSPAFVFALAKHGGQFRSDGTRYIFHPVRTFNTLNTLFDDTDSQKFNICSSALLHDVLEDTNTTASEIEFLVGEEITNIVKELTNPSNLTHQTKLEYLSQHMPHMSDNAISVKLADRLDNISTIISVDKLKQLRYTYETYCIINKLVASNRHFSQEQKELINKITNKIEEYSPSFSTQIDLLK